MMKFGKQGPKTHLQLLIITIGAAEDKEMNIFVIITLKEFFNILRNTHLLSCRQLDEKIANFHIY